jgi:predicted NUDIX family phosphoesterase
VLVIPETHFRRVGFFQGFRPYDAEYAKSLLDPAMFQFLPRPEAELDPRFKQLIPYSVLTFDGRVFVYRRGQKGTEKRLQGSYSIGFGGHINPIDQTETDVYLAGKDRELDEEVKIGKPLSEQILGFIYDDASEVGRVHLGIVHTHELYEPQATILEDKLETIGWWYLPQCLEMIDEFETWSKLTIQAMQANGILDA